MFFGLIYDYAPKINYPKSTFKPSQYIAYLTPPAIPYTHAPKNPSRITNISLPKSNIQTHSKSTLPCHKPAWLRSASLRQTTNLSLPIHTLAPHSCDLIPFQPLNILHKVNYLLPPSLKTISYPLSKISCEHKIRVVVIVLLLVVVVVGHVDNVDKVQKPSPYRYFSHKVIHILMCISCG